MRRQLWAPLLAALLASAGCHRQSEGPPVLLVVVSIDGSPPPVVALQVVLNSSTVTISRRYGNGTPIVFPTTLSAEVQTKLGGDAIVDITAFDAQGNTVARGRSNSVALGAGIKTVIVALMCAMSSCGPVDGGVTADGSGASDGAPDSVIASCGNGSLDPGEACDTAIAAGQPGACPPDPTCDDGSPCTLDALVGTGCAAVCTHTEMTVRLPGDGCCPAGATNADDSDCSATCGNGTIEPGETCDPAVGGPAGVCPTANDCASAAPCVTALLTSADTCQARCLWFPINAPSGQMTDGCCPAGVTADLDADCAALCGNGVLDAGEMCDPAIAATQPGACPPSCDDGNPCTADQRTGAGCQATCVHTPITSFTAGDGCCPSGGNRNADSDCPAKCGNGVLEEGETCDSGAGSPVPCPASCPASPSACLKRVLTGHRDACDVVCAVQAITACSPRADGCCPAGCSALTDADCSATCGNGTVENQAGEVCDTGIAAGAPGACPTDCSDGLPCTSDYLVSAGTCQARCVYLPITVFVPGDDCCPPGGHAGVDADCAPVCGNGIVEPPSESCDFGADPNACARACPPSNGCRFYALAGSPSQCSASCVASVTTACLDGDGCCPVGCTSLTDKDCLSLCGDGVVEPGEACDRGITAGAPGACAASCDDGDACTVDVTSGTAAACTRSCAHFSITACLSGDRCCPRGCGPINDADCGGTCGDGVVGGGETCDPPPSCPTTCPDDGDRCTTEQLIGDPRSCTAACRHLPITTCSGASSDGCCPTGCDHSSDSDC